MRCPVRKGYVALALARHIVGLGAMSAEKSLGVGLNEPGGLLATPQSSEHG